MKKAALAAAALGSSHDSPQLLRQSSAPGPSAGTASSHREAPLISEDPSADNTDLYAFRSPDKPDTVTIVSNWIPAEDPAAGPNYYTFSPSAKYKINIDRTGDARPDIVYEFRFGRTAGPAFLGNTVQAWSMWRNKKLFARGKTPPNNIGPRSTPNYRSLAEQGDRQEGRHLDLRRPARRRVLRRHRVDLRHSSASARARATQAAARTSSPATRCTPSRCRSRSRS